MNMENVVCKKVMFYRIKFTYYTKNVALYPKTYESNPAQNLYVEDFQIF